MGFHILVLAGGSGTRLWPLSRQSIPKHLLPLGPGGTTLLRATVERVLGLGDSVSIVTRESHVELCRRALEGLDLGPEAFVAEADARGTGPALGLATVRIARRDPDAVICSVHADHAVADVEGYRAAVLAAAGWAARTGGLATVGLRPTHPATGFGYIELGDSRASGDWASPSPTAPEATVTAAAALAAHRSLGFAEKPSAEVAERFVADGRHLWNLGLFAWPADRFLHELAAADAGLDAGLREVEALVADGNVAAAAHRYRALPTIPVEPLIFERTQDLTVVSAEFAWSDLGSWADLYESADAPAGGNVSEGDTLMVDSSGCLVRSQGARLVALVGLRDTAVIDTDDAVLVVSLADSQRVKDVVDRLVADQRSNLI